MKAFNGTWARLEKPESKNRKLMNGFMRCEWNYVHNNIDKAREIVATAAATAASSIITLLQNQFIGGVNKLKVQKSAHIQM